MPAQVKKIDRACFLRFSKLQPTRKWANEVNLSRLLRDCSLFMPKRGPVFRVGGGGGVKFSKSIEKGGVFF